MPATATIYTCVHLHAASGSEAPLPHTTLHGAGADPIEGHALRDLVVALYLTTGGSHGRSVGTSTISDATSKDKLW